MENYKERENNIINGINKLAEMNRILRLQCESFIRDFVKEYGEDDMTGCFSFSIYDYETCTYLGDMNVCCTYDGGNHPEYAANPYSPIRTIKYKNKNLYVDIEEAEDYYLDSIFQLMR